MPIPTPKRNVSPMSPVATQQPPVMQGRPHPWQPPSQIHQLPVNDMAADIFTGSVAEYLGGLGPDEEASLPHLQHIAQYSIAAAQAYSAAATLFQGHS